MISVGLVLHPTKPVAESVDMIVDSARDEPVRVVAREIDRTRVPPGVDVVPEAAFREQVDGVVALGGDGTMLGAMRLMTGRPVPILGVNHGNLGFLVEVTPSGLPSALRRLATGDYTVESHAALEVNAGETRACAFNDVVIGRTGAGRTASVDLTVNEVHYGYYKADAVIVATPTGSTAYNYSAGGPILSPSSNALVVTPVAPMSGISRPVVLGGGDRVSFQAEGALVVEADGTGAHPVAAGTDLTVHLKPDAAQVVRLSPRDYANRSRVRLSLLDLPLRPDQLLELIPLELRRNVAAAIDAPPEPPTADGSGAPTQGS
ncbi:NAD(+)/NADH kinase [Asanoa sp. WMMD1127]|uniref:NAD(+)/NADH kinase n=1 Tax=Asanoa sp. WMMD1127 TaxID=3016107 RepID=UPI002417694D|nr:NAD(+)/NADH kinase [Asanoa sp. WMMD1127]MDG4826987.1 NAD(+)/NADH kinase [Asanoa sp. WMMD1127]